MNVRDYAIPAGLTAAVLLLVAVDILRGGGADSSAPQSSQTIQANASSPEVIAKAWDFYKTRPYYERPREHSPIPEGLGDLRSTVAGKLGGKRTGSDLEIAMTEGGGGGAGFTTAPP